MAAKKKQARKSKKVDVASEVDEFSPTSIHGELFWEYRAKAAEYEKALLELTMCSRELKTELSDPKYKRIVELISNEETFKAQLKEYANLMRGAQVKVANSLGISIETFLKNCLIDYETGVVRILE